MRCQIRLRCQHRGCRHGQVGHAQTAQHRRHTRRACHFAAYANLDTVLISGLSRHADQAQHARMQRTIEVGNLLVDTVDRAGVLNQVVGADREEVDFLSQHVRADCGNRDLDHDTNLDIRIELRAFSRQQILGLLQYLFGIADLFDRRDHREHDAQIAVLSRAQQRTQLGQEQVGLIQANADCAIAEERVLFLFQLQRWHFLIAADVQRTDNNRLTRHDLAGLLISFVLLFFAGQVITIHKQELGAEQADAFAAQISNAHRVVRRADVALDHNATTIARAALLVLELRKHCLAGILGLFLLFELCQRLRIRIDDHFTSRTVQQQIRAVLNAVDLIARARNCRDAERTRHNGRMAGAAANTGDKARNRLGANLSGVRRGQVVCNDNARFGDRINRIIRNAFQVLQDALGDITDIRRARLHVFAVHRPEHCLEILAVDKASILRANLILCYQIGHAFHKVRIIQHQQMRIKNLRLGSADGLLGLITQHLDLLLCLFHRIGHARLLGRDIGDAVLDNRQVCLLNDQRFGVCQALRHANRLELNHLLSPPISHILYKNVVHFIKYIV